MPRYLALDARRTDGDSSNDARQLLDYTGFTFEYSHEYKAGNLSRDTFVAWMAPVRRQFEAVLAQAVSAEIAGVSGSCADILEHQAAPRRRHYQQSRKRGGARPTRTASRRVSSPAPRARIAAPVRSRGAHNACAGVASALAREAVPGERVGGRPRASRVRARRGLRGGVR